MKLPMRGRVAKLNADCVATVCRYFVRRVRWANFGSGRMMSLSLRDSMVSGSQFPTADWAKLAGTCSDGSALDILSNVGP